MTRWQSLRRVLKPLEQEEPGLEGLEWPLFLMGNSFRGSARPAGFTLRHAIRWLRSVRFSQCGLSDFVWYGMHERTPAQEMPFSSVHRELAGRGIRGNLLGPYPFSKVDVCEVWRQLPLVCGPGTIDPGTFFQLGRLAEDLTHGLADSLSETPGLFDGPVLPTELLPLVWGTLALDRQMAALIRRNTPRVLVVGNDIGPISNPLVRHARNAGAYTLILQHGLQGENTGTMAAEQISLWGDYHRDVTRGHGAPAKALVVDGSPRMDLVLAATQDYRTRVDARSKLGIAADEHVLLHFLDNMGVIRKLYPSVVPQFKEHATEAFSVLTKRMRVMVRPHPSESDRDWEYLRAAGCIIVEPGKMPLSSVISAADVASTMISTAGLEALWCGKPLVFFRPPGALPLGDLVSLGAGPAVGSAREWSEMVTALALNSQAREGALESAAVFSAASLAYPGEGGRRVADRVEAHL